MVKRKSKPKEGLPWGRPIKHTQEFIDREREALEEWLEKDGNYFLKDFSTERRYCKDTITVFCKRCSKFSITHKKALEKQESWMWKRGFDNKAPNFIRWALSTLHKYKFDPDKVENVEEAVNLLKDFVKSKNYGDKSEEEDGAES